MANTELPTVYGDTITLNDREISNSAEGIANALRLTGFDSQEALVAAIQTSVKKDQALTHQKVAGMVSC